MSTSDPLAAFLDDVRTGIGQAEAGELATPEQVASLEAKLARAGYVGMHFDDAAFRDAILQGFNDLQGIPQDETLDTTAERWEGLSKAQQEVAMEVIADFAQLLNCSADVDAFVDRLIAAREFGKALKVVRSKAPFMDRAWTLCRYTEIWEAIAEIHPQFRLIPLAFGGVKQEFILGATK